MGGRGSKLAHTDSDGADAHFHDHVGVARLRGALGAQEALRFSGGGHGAHGAHGAHGHGGKRGAGAGHGDEVNVAPGSAPPPSSFNVLYARTPRVGLLQAPPVRAFAETCEEAAEMVRPLLRLGVRETSLFDKCPLYDPDFHKGPAGHMIMTRRTRELLAFMEDGSLYERPAPREQVPKGRVYISDFPNPFTVLLLNLGAYYLITRQSSRLGGG